MLSLIQLPAFAATWKRLGLTDADLQAFFASGLRKDGRHEDKEG